MSRLDSKPRIVSVFDFGIAKKVPVDLSRVASVEQRGSVLSKKGCLFIFCVNEPGRRYILKVDAVGVKRLGPSFDEAVWLGRSDLLGAHDASAAA